MLKKFFIMSALLAVIVLFIQGVGIHQVEAADVWVYNYNGDDIYITYGSVVYGVKAGFYARCRVKYVDSSGGLVKSEMLEFNHDEGDWWYGIVGVRGSGRRVYDYEDAMEILNWLKAHWNESKPTAVPYQRVLRD